MLRPRIVGRLVLDGDVVLVAEGAELAVEVDDGVEELDDETDELESGDSMLKPCEKPLKSVVDGSSPELSLLSSHANWLLPASGFWNIDVDIVKRGCPHNEIGENTLVIWVMLVVNSSERK